MEIAGNVPTMYPAGASAVKRRWLTMPGRRRYRLNQDRSPERSTVAMIFRRTFSVVVVRVVRLTGRTGEGARACTCT